MLLAKLVLLFDFLFAFMFIEVVFWCLEASEFEDAVFDFAPELVNGFGIWIETKVESTLSVIDAIEQVAVINRAIPVYFPAPSSNFTMLKLSFVHPFSVEESPEAIRKTH